MRRGGGSIPRTWVINGGSVEVPGRGTRCQLGARVDGQFPIDPLQVVTDRVLAHEQLARDVRVALAAGDEPGDRSFGAVSSWFDAGRPPTRWRSCSARARHSGEPSVANVASASRSAIVATVSASAGEAPGLAPAGFGPHQTAEPPRGDERALNEVRARPPRADPRLRQAFLGSAPRRRGPTARPQCSPCECSVSTSVRASTRSPRAIFASIASAQNGNAPGSSSFIVAAIPGSGPSQRSAAARSPTDSSTKPSTERLVSTWNTSPCDSAMRRPSAAPSRYASTSPLWRRPAQSTRGALRAPGRSRIPRASGHLPSRTAGPGPSGPHVPRARPCTRAPPITARTGLCLHLFALELQRGPRPFEFARPHGDRATHGPGTRL